MNNFIILSTQRSGSNLLGTLLESHPRIDYFGEALKDKPDECFQPHNYHYFRTQSRVNRLTYRYISKKRVASSYWKFTDSLKKSPDHIVGFKAMVSQLRKYNELGQIPKSFKLIKLTRENLLKVYLSGLFARKTNQYVLFSEKDKNQEVKKIEIEIESVIPSLTSLKETNQFIHAYFNGNGSYEITYEALLKNKEFQVRRLFSFLELDEPGEISSPLKKQNSDCVEDLVVNYEELHKKLLGTEFEEFLWV